MQTSTTSIAQAEIVFAPPSSKPAVHPLLSRLTDEFGADWVNAETLHAFLAQQGEQILFFMGDSVRYPEGLDVAVVLPELNASFANCFHLGVVDKADESTIAKQFAVRAWPSLVFLRNGEYVDTIANMQDWDVYVDMTATVLKSAPKRIPISIPVVSSNASANSNASASACA